MLLFLMAFSSFGIQLTFVNNILLPIPSSANNGVALPPWFNSTINMHRIIFRMSRSQTHIKLFKTELWEIVSLLHPDLKLTNLNMFD